MRAWRFVVPLIALMIFAACGGDDDDNRPPDVERFELTSGLSESDPLVPGGFVNIEVWLDDPDGVGDVDSSKVFFYDGYLWIRLERDPTDRSHFRATHDIPCPDYLGAHLGAVKVYDKHGNKDKQKFSIYYVTSCEMCNEPPELGQIYYWVNETLDAVSYTHLRAHET